MEDTTKKLSNVQAKVISMRKAKRFKLAHAVNEISAMTLTSADDITEG